MFIEQYDSSHTGIVRIAHFDMWVELENHLQMGVELDKNAVSIPWTEEMEKGAKGDVEDS